MYTTIEKLKRSIGDKAELILRKTTDSHLTEILDDISKIIDSYIKTVIKLPISDENAIIDQVCICLAKAEIYRRFAANDLPKDVSEQENKAYATLEKIQQKKIVIVATEEQQADIKFIAKKQVFDTCL